MTPGSLSFASHEWFWPAVVLFLAALFFIWRSYSGTGLSPRIRALSVALKILGMALLLAILLEPTWTATRPREGANFFAVLADNSMGMQLRDAGASETRAELLRRTLTSDQSEWQGRLDEFYSMRRFLFDSRLESARDFSDLDFNGRETALGGALKSVAQRFQGQPLAGVLLFTDGNATDLDKGFSQLAGVSGLPPIYPVLIGKSEPIADLALKNVSATQTVFEDSPVTLSATLSAAGFPNEQIFARVTQDGKMVAQQQVVTAKDNDEIPLRFELKPRQSGVSAYELTVGLAAKTNSAEATLFNNSRGVVVDRGRGPHRLLYVSGRANWEFKFMNRAVSEDPELQLVSLIRIARREPKFTFRGRTGESSNPLFRGFNPEEEETARYDQPVLIRVNTKDENELRGGFPKTAEELYPYEAVILDDLEAGFFTADQMMLVQHYVSERGGGFLMLGGADSMQDGNYARTPIGDLLPMYLDRTPGRAATPMPGDSFRFELTREGWLQPWIRLRNTEQEERLRLDSLPGFQVLNRLREAKPGASVLALVRDANGNKYPAVAVQRFGNGRAAAIALGDLWRGGLQNEKMQADLAKSWRQMLRWLIADVPRQFELHVQPAEEGSGVNLITRVRDKKFAPVENASVQITISPLHQSAPSTNHTNRVSMTADASVKEAGVYRASYVPRTSGGYLATAVITDSSGVKLGEAEVGWQSEPQAREFASLVPNRALLEEIARKTGGEMVDIDHLDRFVQSLKRKGAPVVETYSFPVWNTSAVFLAALACFVAEWGIRRVKGLA